MNAPHGWVRLDSFGGKWHRATCSGTPACGARIAKESERADVPPQPKQSSGASVCVQCFRIAIGADPCCACGCHESGTRSGGRE